MAIDNIPIPELPPALAGRFLLLRRQAVDFLDAELQRNPENIEAAARREKYISEMPDLERAASLSLQHENNNGNILFTMGE